MNKSREQERAPGQRRERVMQSEKAFMAERERKTNPRK